MAGLTYGYARVSSRDQNLDRHLDALTGFGVERARIYADKASGRDFERLEYRRLVEVLDAGDVLAVKSIDRLGRNYEEVIEQWRLLTKELAVDVVVLDMPLLDISSTALRHCIAQGRDASYGLDAAVWEEIRRKGYYLAK